jgi:diguanylate cyclase (GGDEF)-like protein
MMQSQPIPDGPAGLEIGRAELLQALQHHINQAGNSIVAVLMLEIRRANRLEALIGGPPASVVIEHAAQRLSRLLRSEDRFARLSNEQICVILPNLANTTLSVLAAVKIMATLQKPFGIGEHSVLMRPCLGIATYPEHGEDPEQLLMFADLAARIAATREEGYHIYRAEGRVAPEVFRGLDVDLAKAIKANELRVEYQPIIDLSSGKCVSAEALLRWSAPGGRDMAPETIIDVAESTGLIAPLTSRVLNTALRQSGEFARAGVQMDIAVNLSAKMLIEDEFPDIVQQALQTWGISAQCLDFEITESALIGDIERSLTMLRRLRALGVGLSIDDFGTGYSSLAYLKRFPVHELKIDKLFVQNMRLARGDLQIVRSVIDLAHNFDLLAVAEGVEDLATLEQLRSLGCDRAQGFHISQSLPADDFVSWYLARK